MNTEINRLRHENNVLKQKLWAKQPGHVSEYFILVDTKFKPQTDYEKSAAEDYIDQSMIEFSSQIQDMIRFNKKRHHWSSDYIDSVEIKYVIEIGSGKLKKDGTRGKSGGTLHFHINVYIEHHSNITLMKELVEKFFKNFFQYHLGTSVFVSVRLVNPNYVEKYMTKTLVDPDWKVIDVQI